MPIAVQHKSHAHILLVVTMSQTTNITIMINRYVNVLQVILNGESVDHAHMRLLAYCTLYSDYGHHRDGNTCVKEEGYDLSKHCIVGQKTYVKSSSGLRLIPGDLCSNPGAFAKFTNATCTGHDYDAGVDYPDDNRRSKV